MRNCSYEKRRRRAQYIARAGFGACVLLPVVAFAMECWVEHLRIGPVTVRPDLPVFEVRADLGLATSTRLFTGPAKRAIQAFPTSRARGLRFLSASSPQHCHTFCGNLRDLESTYRLGCCFGLHWRPR